MSTLKALLSNALIQAKGSPFNLAQMRLLLQEALAKVNALEHQAAKNDWRNKNMGGN